VPKACAKNTEKQEDEVLDFYRSLPEVDECRFLIKKVVEQAVRDYSALEHSTSASEQFDYQTAVGFLFDDSYRVNWGGQEMSLQDLLDWVDLEAEWVRKKAKQAKERRIKKALLKQNGQGTNNEFDEDTEDCLSSGLDGVLD